MLSGVSLPKSMDPRNTAPCLALLATCRSLSPRERESVYCAGDSTPSHVMESPGKAAAVLPIAKTQLIKDGTQGSVTLALEDSLNKGMFIVHIFIDSWVVANGPAIWSNQQAQNRFHIQDCSQWGLHIGNIFMTYYN